MCGVGRVTVHRVEVRPMGYELYVTDGDALMSAAQNLGYWWPNVCGGEAACAVCWVVVESGMEGASPVDADEALRLEISGRWRRDDRSRLACQMRVYGPMRVYKRGVRKREQGDERER